MWTMAKIRDGSTYLGNHLTANDYYSENERVVGQWQGKLAVEFGLAQGIEAGDEAFENLRTGRVPDGSAPLTQRASKGDKVSFLDFQCSCEKSVSVMSMLDPRLAHAHARAANAAFLELEKLASRQVQAGGKSSPKTTGNLLAAVFQHDASRALDPQLHTHFVVANVTQDSDGRRFTLESLRMCQAIRYCSSFYNAKLGEEVQKLGYSMQTRRNDKGQIVGFQLAGVSPEICDRYSKRRADIEAGIESFRAEHGRAPSQAEIHTITLQTRSAKLAEITTPEVRAKQLGQLSKQELTSLKSLAANASKTGTKSAPSLAAAEKAVAASIAHVFERQSVAAQHELLAEALLRSSGQAAPETVAAVMAARPELEQLGEGDGLLARLTTREIVQMESASVTLANTGCGRHKALAPHASGKIKKELGDDQRKAVAAMLENKDRVLGIRGVAGAGKTTLLKEADRLLLVEGKSGNILYLAPTASAVETLRAEGFSKATTVSDYLSKTKSGKAPGDWEKALVVVDEAGLQSLKQGHAVLKNASRLVLVGDARQHSAVEGGEFFRLLQDHSKMQVVEVGKIHRQRPDDYRAAIEKMSSGQAKEGLEDLDKMGWLKEGGASYIAAAAKEYAGKVAEGKSVLAVAPTHAEGDALNGAIRKNLVEQKQLGEVLGTKETAKSLQLSVADKKDAGRYKEGLIVTATTDLRGVLRLGESAKVQATENGQVILLDNGKRFDPTKHGAALDLAEPRQAEIRVGEKLLVTKNDKRKGLVNGEILTVSGISENGEIRTKEGKTIPANNPHLVHGYAVTSHKSQGKTVDAVVVCAAKLDAKTAYVAASRGRESCSVHTPKKKELMERVPEGKKPNAADLLAGHRQEKKAKTLVSQLRRTASDIISVARGWGVVATKAAKKAAQIVTAREPGKPHPPQKPKPLVLHTVQQLAELKRPVVAREEKESQTPILDKLAAKAARERERGRGSRMR